MFCIASIKEKFKNHSPRKTFSFKIIGTLLVVQGLALLGNLLWEEALALWGYTLSFFDALRLAAEALGAWVAPHYLIVVWAVATLNFVQMGLRLNTPDKFSPQWFDWLCLAVAIALLGTFYSYWGIVVPQDASFAYQVSLFAAIALLVCSLMPWLHHAPELDGLVGMLFLALMCLPFMTMAAFAMEAGEATEAAEMLTLLLLHFLANFGGVIAGGLLYGLDAAGADDQAPG